MRSPVLFLFPARLTRAGVRSQAARMKNIPPVVVAAVVLAAGIVLAAYLLAPPAPLRF